MLHNWFDDNFQLTANDAFFHKWHPISRANEFEVNTGARCSFTGEWHCSQMWSRRWWINIKFRSHAAFDAILRQLGNAADVPHRTPLFCAPERNECDTATVKTAAIDNDNVTNKSYTHNVTNKSYTHTQPFHSWSLYTSEAPQLVLEQSFTACVPTSAIRLARKC